MIGQSAAIVAVILVMSFMFLRSGRRAGALLALPLISVPSLHLLGSSLHKLLNAGSLPPNLLHAAIDVFGFAAGCFFLWMLSRGIKVKKLKYVYLACCVFFLAALTAAYVSALL